MNCLLSSGKKGVGKYLLCADRGRNKFVRWKHEAVSLISWLPPLPGC